jgi:hypothetical protein
LSLRAYPNLNTTPTRAKVVFPFHAVIRVCWAPRRNFAILRMGSFEKVYSAVHEHLVKPSQLRGSRYEDLQHVAAKLDEKCVRPAESTACRRTSTQTFTGRHVPVRAGMRLFQLLAACGADGCAAAAVSTATTIAADVSANLVAVGCSAVDAAAVVDATYGCCS